jgi:pantothenate kinase-related protein Tda10
VTRRLTERYATKFDEKRKALALRLAEALLELGNATASIEDLLLARVERVALATHVSVNLATFGRAARHELAPTGTSDLGVDVLGVDTGFHYFS